MQTINQVVSAVGECRWSVQTINQVVSADGKCRWSVHMVDADGQCRWESSGGEVLVVNAGALCSW